MLIRDYRKSDLNECAKLIKQTWNLTDKCENIFNDNQIYRLYVKECLLNCNYKKVVVCENKIIAVFFAKRIASGFMYSFIDNIICSLYLVQNLLEILKGSYGKRYLALKAIMKQYILDRMGEKDVYDNTYTNEITLFIVGEKYQNHGIGKTLLSNYIFDNSTNTKFLLFVWTTSDCNYKFYEKHKFEIISKLDIRKLWESEKPYYLIKYKLKIDNL